jgi:hypothetical protein
MNDDEDAQPWIRDFLFGAPLYAERSFPREGAFRMFVKDLVVDGHCPYCRRNSTFRRSEGEMGVLQYETIIQFRPVRFKEGNMQKIGQYPSLADIANDESRAYRQVLDKDDAADLHRAIGLAAHGVGVGAFVYLRRVLENLITNRFFDFNESEGWNVEDFFGKHMNERIELLNEHLPQFLVSNVKLYAILSKGIHQLTEEECLRAFEFLKQSTFFILDEDKRKKEELEARRRVEKAIAAFSGSKGE